MNLSIGCDSEPTEISSGSPEVEFSALPTIASAPACGQMFAALCLSFSAPCPILLRSGRHVPALPLSLFLLPGSEPTVISRRCFTHWDSIRTPATTLHIFVT